MAGLGFCCSATLSDGILKHGQTRMLLLCYSIGGPQQPPHIWEQLQHNSEQVQSESGSRSAPRSPTTKVSQAVGHLMPPLSTGGLNRSRFAQRSRCQPCDYAEKGPYRA